MSDIFKEQNNINEITSDFSKDMLALQTLRDLKAKIEADGVTSSMQHDIDTLILTSFDNTELQKIKSEILNLYNKLEKEARTFFGFTYASIDEKIIAEAEYKEIASLRNKALNAGDDILLRKKILNKINNMSFHMKNAAPLLYDIDLACRTYNGFTYNSMSDIDSAMNELTLIDEFIKIDEILDNTKEISAIINIRAKVNEIEKHNYSNSEIKKRLKSINQKLNSLDNDLKHFNGVRYSSLEEVKIIQDELYYIDTETYKFDMLSKDGLKFFLELMSLREFQSDEAKSKIEKYRLEYFNLEDNEIKHVKSEMKISNRNKKRTKLRIAIGIQIFTTALFIASFFATSFWVVTPAAIVFGLSLAYLILYSIYYNVYKGVEYVHDAFNSKIKSKFKKD